MSVSIEERARNYLGKMEGAVSGSGGHDATYYAACVLIQGFGLSIAQARPLFQEWNQRCSPPWSESELEHKLKEADKAVSAKGRGYLLGKMESRELGVYDSSRRAERWDKDYENKPVEKPDFKPERLKQFAGSWVGEVNLLWLADRSAFDPATVSSKLFLQSLFFANEKVIVFKSAMSQGDFVFPDDDLPSGGPDGVWFLCQPVDGKSHPNPRSGKMSRRSEESVLSFRYFVLESDEADLRIWLAALAQLPLKIAAIYTSGGRSIHALIEVNARTKGEWDELKLKAKSGLVLLGADPGAMSAVRLTRLPGCYREKKKCWQKLLYLNPRPEVCELVDLRPRRDTEKLWLDYAEAGVSDSDESGGKWLLNGLGFYSNVSPVLKKEYSKLKSEF